MDEPGFVTVLNDIARVGDRVAIAVSDARYGNGMRTGTVLEIGGTERRPLVKVRVEQTSAYSSGPFPYVKTFGDPGRMVKLGDTQDAR
jgi:hypothetical protein